MRNLFKSQYAESETEDTPARAGVVAEEKRTTLSLSLTVRDKKTLKLLAAERGTTIAAIIHEWITEHTKRKGSGK